MDKIFEEIYTLDGVMGILYFNDGGTLLFEKMKKGIAPTYQGKTFSEYFSSVITWQEITKSVNRMKEAEFVFSNKRLYFKKANTGLIIVIANHFVSIAMIRMNCQIIMPDLDKLKKPKGLGRFFKI